MLNQQRIKQIHTFTLLLLLLLGLEIVRAASATKRSVAQDRAPLLNVSAASYRDSALAPETIVAAFGTKLATTTRSAAAAPLPTELAGTRVAVKDSLGVERLAPLFFVSPTQVNYLMPAGTAVGAASVTIRSGDGSVSSGATQIETVAPGLFAAAASGSGPAAALALRVKADRGQYFEPVARFNKAQQKFFLAPLDFGPDTGATSDQIFLILYGTGLRHRSALSAITAKAGGVDAQVIFAGAQGDFAGLDQINLRLPRLLAGRGEIELALTIDGRQANLVRIAIGAPSNFAYFRFDSPPQAETFVIKLTETEKIAHARAVLSGRTQDATQVMGFVVKAPAAYNAPWSYHLDPSSISFFDSATEVCSAAIYYVEEHLAAVGTDFLPGNIWCPWGSRLLKELPRAEVEPIAPPQLK